jgi:hypothetical protein
MHLFDMTWPQSYRAGYLAGFGGSTAERSGEHAAAGQGRKAVPATSTTTVFTGGEIRGFLAQVPGIRRRGR